MMGGGYVLASRSNYDAVATAAAGFGVVTWLISMAVAVVMLVAMWKIFVKAGEPGWAAIVPFYNLYTLFKIVWGNGLLFLLCFVPIVNFVILIIAYAKLARAFGKGGAFMAGLIFLTPIFMCILAFGDAQYVGVQ